MKLLESEEVLKSLKEKFDDEYKKLRKCRKSDATYDRINGFLDALDYVRNLILNEE